MNPFTGYIEIKFADIRPGDIVMELTQISEDVVSCYAGKVHKLHGQSAQPHWRDKKGNTVIVLKENKKYFLIERPVPVLPTEEGSVIFLQSYNGMSLTVERMAVLTSGVHPHWHVPGGIQYATSLLYSIEPEKITGWVPAEVRKVD